MNCNAIQEQLEAYALGALEAPAQQAVKKHLANCPNCRRRLAEYEEVVATLPEVLTAVAPAPVPESVKMRLLQQLETGLKPEKSKQDETRYQPPLLRQGRRRTFQLATAVLAFLLILSLVWGMRLNVVLARERALRAEVADLVGQQELILEIVDSNKTERTLLLPPAGDSNAYGKLFVRTDMPYLVAMAARLPQPPVGQAYHLWLITGAQARLAGVMAVDSDGFGLLIYDAGQATPTYDAAQLTLQPLGSTTPATSPILTWAGE